MKDMLIEEKERLLVIRDKARKRLECVPEGTLRLGKCRGSTQYFQNIGEKSKGKYLSSKEVELAKSLAQKTYDEKVLKCVEKRLSQIEAVLKDYEDNEIEAIYMKEHLERRKLIEPVEPTYEQKLECWLSEPYVKKGFYNEALNITTNSGMRVRSKSEKIMADYFDSIGVKYKYECPLELKTYGTVYPDFTFLSPKTGREIYWEHEGMMDHPEYARSAVKKIETYENNNIYPGERLILSFETSESVINMNLIKEMTERYLL